MRGDYEYNDFKNIKRSGSFVEENKGNNNAGVLVK